MQAGVVAALETLVKEFVSAGDVEKKAAYNRLQEEVAKLEGPSSR